MLHVLTEKYIVIKYRIAMIHPTDPKKLNKKEGPSKDASTTFRRVNKIVIGGRGREVPGRGEKGNWGQV